jgi:hypothetical protein
MEGLKMLEALLLLFGMLAAAAIGGRESESKDEEETYEKLRKNQSLSKRTKSYSIPTMGKGKTITTKPSIKTFQFPFFFGE